MAAVRGEKSAEVIVPENEPGAGRRPFKLRHRKSRFREGPNRTDEPTRSPFHGDEPDRGSQKWTWEPGREREFMWLRATRQT
jgi:hypothetical protein